ncbi:hypothetical protein ACQ4PT_002695 [Festuca glaucescens]
MTTRSGPRQARAVVDRHCLFAREPRRHASATASASCSSHPLPSPLITNGGAGAAPRAGAAKFRALITPLQRSSSFIFGCACSSAPTPGDKDRDRDLFDEYSVLSADIPWESEDIWRTFAGYLLILHIPLSFGGLDAVAKVLHCYSLDPLTTVVSTAMLQLGELTLGPEDAYDPILKEILSDSPTSRLVCFFLYCVIAPLSEETIYRGFLLTSLSSSMKWKNAVIVSSLMFSVAHLSGQSFFQLFIIGCITGLAYCRTGTLAASFTIHSLYNAVILITTIMS